MLEWSRIIGGQTQGNYLTLSVHCAAYAHIFLEQRNTIVVYSPWTDLYTEWKRRKGPCARVQIIQYYAMDHDMFNWLLMELEIEQDIECQLEIENELISRWLELEIKFEEVTRVEREQGITARVHEVKCELQAIRLPSLILEQLRSRLDDGTKRNQGKRKLHGYERGYDILKERLHQLKRQFEEIQESKWKLEREADECRRWSVRWHVRAIEPKLYFLKCEFMQKLRELNRWQKEILLKVAYLDSLLVWLLVLYAVHAEDAHEGGGFKNLLDGWWLEFWEIVLLAAGDVERNPGPRQITDDQLAGVSDTPIGKLVGISITTLSTITVLLKISEEDDLSLIFDAVRPISSKWSRLCCSLGLRASLLDTIEKNHPRDVDDCLFEGLKRWILKNYDTTKHGLPTWRRLVEAVDNSSDNHALALKIAEEHKS